MNDNLDRTAENKTSRKGSVEMEDSLPILKTIQDTKLSTSSSVSSSPSSEETTSSSLSLHTEKATNSVEDLTGSVVKKHAVLKKSLFDDKDVFIEIPVKEIETKESPPFCVRHICLDQNLSSRGISDITSEDEDANMDESSIPTLEDILTDVSPNSDTYYCVPPSEASCDSDDESSIPKLYESENIGSRTHSTSYVNSDSSEQSRALMADSENEHVIDIQLNFQSDVVENNESTHDAKVNIEEKLNNENTDFDMNVNLIPKTPTSVCEITSEPKNYIKYDSDIGEFSDFKEKVLKSSSCQSSTDVGDNLIKSSQPIDLINAKKLDEMRYIPSENNIETFSEPTPVHHMSSITQSYIISPLIDLYLPTQPTNVPSLSNVPSAIAPIFTTPVFDLPSVTQLIFTTPVSNLPAVTQPTDILPLSNLQAATQPISTTSLPDVHSSTQPIFTTPVSNLPAATQPIFTTSLPDVHSSTQSIDVPLTDLESAIKPESESCILHIKKDQVFINNQDDIMKKRCEMKKQEIVNKNQIPLQIDIYGDGSYIKSVLHVGDNINIDAGSVVLIHYRCFNQQQTQIYQQRKWIVVADFDVPVAVDTAIRSMKQHEMARFLCPLSDMRIGFPWCYEKCDDVINDTVEFEVTIEKVMHIRDIASPSFPLFEICETKKQVGNGYFQRKDYSSAGNYYYTCLQYMDFPANIRNMPNALRELGIVVTNNVALCKMKLKSYGQAIELLEEILKIDPYNFKALIRISNCFEIRLDFEKALHFAERAIAIEDDKSMRENICKMRAQISKNKAEIEEVYKHMISGISDPPRMDTTQSETSWGWYCKVALVSLSVLATGLAVMCKLKNKQF